MKFSLMISNQSTAGHCSRMCAKCDGAQADAEAEVPEARGSISSIAGGDQRHFGVLPNFFLLSFIICSYCLRAISQMSFLSGTAHSPCPLQVF